MREIKFRVWDNELKTFPFIGFDILGETTVFDVVKQYSLEKITNNTLTIEQYTGLKDKNGVEIYEGDICIHAYESDIKGVISFFEGSFIIGIAICSNSLINFNAPRNLQVIGNIHQTPELLK